MDTTREITVEISNFCPLNCIHCSTRYSPAYSHLDESIIDVDSVISKTIEHIKPEKGSVRIRFSGGEPVLFIDRSIVSKSVNIVHNH